MALQPGPWSDDGRRGVGAQRRPKLGARFFGFFFIDWKKKLARKARNKTLSHLDSDELQTTTVRPFPNTFITEKGVCHTLKTHP
jgi:hypothetical protein